MPFMIRVIAHSRKPVSARVTVAAFSLLFGAGVLAGCRPQKPAPAVLTSPAPPDATDGSGFSFTDITARSGVVSLYDNGEASGSRSIVESIGGGLGALDFDRDGVYDLVMPGGGQIVPDGELTGHPTQLWQQVSPLRFRSHGELAGLAAPRTLTHGVACGDYDNDGFPDIVITGFDGLQLMHNLGDGRFEDCSSTAGLDADTRWSTSASWLDVDADGDLDLYVVHYVDWSWKHHPECFAGIAGVRDVCSPNEFDALPDTLFLNDGEGHFEDVSNQWGLTSGGKGLGVIAAQLDDDDAIDLYVANDTVENALYLNETTIFREQGLLRGVAVDSRGVPNGSMGLALLDYDNDLCPDLWVTNYEDETCALYQGDGEGSFRWAADRAGVNALGTLFVAFGTAAGDFDLDGDEDLAVVNGHVILNPRKSEQRQVPLFLCNTSRSRASDSPARLVRQAFPEGSYFASKHRGRGLIAVDLEGDGDLDLVSTHVKEPAAVLRNDSKLRGKGLTLELIGRSANRDAIGARVILKTDSSSSIRQVVGGGSYLSQGPYRVSLAIPDGETVESIEIRWPDGQTQEIDAPNGGPRDGVVRVVQDKAQDVP